MFSPLNDPQVEDWFRRLEAAWKRMPADEQTRQREEVQQHLEGLVAAKVAAGQSSEDAWNIALVRFGNPTRIGRKLCREWSQSRTGFRAEMAAIFFALELQVLIRLLCVLSGLLMTIGISPIIYVILYLSCFPFACIVVGRKYPMQAIKGMLYTSLVCSLWQNVVYHHGATFLVEVALVTVFQISVAYLASVTKRGWYRPTWEDFKLTLPKWGRIAR